MEIPCWLYMWSKGVSVAAPALPGQRHVDTLPRIAITPRADGSLVLRTWGGISESPDQPTDDIVLHVDGRVASGTEDDGDDSACKVVLLRLNNGVAMEENGWCGDRYCFYGGAFKPAAPSSR